MRTSVTITGLVLISVVCVAYAQDNPSPTQGQQVIIYACPSHPQIAATWPALCPYCQTTLQRVAAVGGARGGGSSATAGGRMGTGAGAATGGQASPRAGTQAPQAQQGGGTFGRSNMGPTFRGQAGDEARERAFQGREFGDRFPNEEFRDRQFSVPDEGFRGDEFGERSPNEEFRERQFAFPDRDFPDRFRGDEFFGQESPNGEFRDRLPGEEFRERRFGFPDEDFRGRFRGDEFGEGFNEPFEGEEFGERGFLGPEEVFPREQFGFGDEFMEPGFGNEGFGEG